MALTSVAQWDGCVILQTKRSSVQFAVGAHSWVAGQVPHRGRVRGNQSMFLLHINISLPLSLPSPLSKKK